MSYSRLVISKAFAETKAYWNIHKIWAYASVPASAIVLRVLIRGRSQVSGWQEVLLFAVFGFAVAWVGSYCINLIRVPSILHHQQRQTITGLESTVKALRAENAGLTQPQFTLLQQEQIEIVRQSLDNCSSEVKAFVRRLLTHGEMSWSSWRRVFAPGIPDSAIHGYAAKAKDLGLVDERYEGPHSERVWFIKPDLKFAVEFYFSPPSQGDRRS